MYVNSSSACISHACIYIYMYMYVRVVGGRPRKAITEEPKLALKVCGTQAGSILSKNERVYTFTLLLYRYEKKSPFFIIEWTDHPDEQANRPNEQATPPTAVGKQQQRQLIHTHTAAAAAAAAAAEPHANAASVLLSHSPSRDRACVRCPLRGPPSHPRRNP